MKSYQLLLIISSVLFIWFERGYADKPCAAREISGQSVVCVCNETYCDDVTRETPASGQYVAYTSSEGGLRFNKVIGEFKNTPADCCSTTVTIDPSVEYQVIEGFGGAVTDAVGINWKNLSETLQKSLLNHGREGLYRQNLMQKFLLLLPFIKQILETSTAPVHIVATTWSPPIWMKSNNAYPGISHLKEEYYQTYADYHLKFLQGYAAEGVNVWAITTTNEPMNGVIPNGHFNCLGWTADNFGVWIVNNLGPTIRNSCFKDVKILGHDEQRSFLPILFEEMVKEHPAVLDYVDGIAVHYYTDKSTPASFLSKLSEKYPGKFVLATEACEGGSSSETEKVLLGSWSRAQTYIDDILEDLNHEVVGWIDWNMCLNEQGGPNWAKNYVDSPVIVFPENKEFVKQPMFYAMGHFSKFIPRGSKRIKIEEKEALLNESVGNVAFLTPRGSIAAVLYNSGKVKTVAVKLGDKQARLELDAKSVTTVEFLA